MAETKHIQKWIGCPVSDEDFERHNERRKQLGMTWSQYIMPAVSEQFYQFATIEASFTSPEVKPQADDTGVVYQLPVRAARAGKPAKGKGKATIPATKEE